MATTLGDIVTMALREVAVVAMADAPDGDEMTTGLFLAAELYDAWNGSEQSQFTEQFLSFTLTPNLQPHTIGLTANAPTLVVTTNRPVRILGANLVLNQFTPNVNQPLDLWDRAAWLAQPVQQLATQNPLALYYEPSWPNGSIFLWPVPTRAYGLQLEVMTPLASIVQTAPFTLPPSYQQAFRLTLAESMVGPFTVPMPQSLPGRALEARARCFANNTQVPRIRCDAGFGRGVRRSNFNYLTGSTT